MVFPWHNYVCKSPLHYHRISFNLNEIDKNSKHKVPIVNNDCFYSDELSTKWLLIIPRSFLFGHPTVKILRVNVIHLLILGQVKIRAPLNTPASLKSLVEILQRTFRVLIRLVCVHNKYIHIFPISQLFCDITYEACIHFANNIWSKIKQLALLIKYSLPYVYAFFSRPNFSIIIKVNYNYNKNYPRILWG